MGSAPGILSHLNNNDTADAALVAPAPAAPAPVVAPAAAERSAERPVLVPAAAALAAAAAAAAAAPSAPAQAVVSAAVERPALVPAAAALAAAAAAAAPAAAPLAVVLSTWTNASDYAPTPETFGTVPLHDEALGDAIEGIQISESVKSTRLRPELDYLRQRCGTKVAFLPVHGRDEYRLYREDHVLLQKFVDYGVIASELCKHVNGTTIFPKLPSCLLQ